jgi:hypothetical protein
MGTVEVSEASLVAIDYDEWNRTKRQAELSMQLWGALLGAVDTAGMGSMISPEIRTLIGEVTSL